MDYSYLFHLTHKKLLKIYNITVFIVLKDKCLPKCIIKHIIVHFCNKPLIILELKYLKKTDGEKNNDEKLYPYYFPNKINYVSYYIINQKCLIINRDGSGFYIDTKFSSHPHLFIYKIKNVEASDENILETTEMIINLFEMDEFYESFYLPFFPDHLLAIFQKYKDLITKVVRAEKERIAKKNKIYSLFQDIECMHQEIDRLKTKNQQLSDIIDLI